MIKTRNDAPKIATQAQLDAMVAQAYRSGRASVLGSYVFGEGAECFMPLKRTEDGKLTISGDFITKTRQIIQEELMNARRHGLI